MIDSLVGMWKQWKSQGGMCLLKVHEISGFENRLPKWLCLAGGDRRDNPEAQCGEHALKRDADNCTEASGLAPSTA